MHISEDILIKCKSNDRAAQRQLYEQCHGILKGICTRYAKDESEVSALLNLGFFKILSGLQSYQTTIPFEAWARRIMINHIIDEYRKNKKLNALVNYNDCEIEESSYIQINETDEKYDAEALIFIIRKLPEPLLSAFNLFAIDGYSHEEIAGILSCSVGTSKWYLNQARNKLKQMLESMPDYIHSNYNAKVK
ncbi:MAG TPA: RNA polymerase sigma factor [Saprospiraceae bacterium]|nr:RNA polymerase sigma factor [Saprospiraceae bacterium]HPN68466.1 RNA polymerase sigma factor [Saprospiraceae bacterium]